MKVHVAVRYRITQVAATGARYQTFFPYVPAICSRGVVAYQATLHGGGSGQFTSDGLCVVETGAELTSIISHPDLNARGELCCYAELRSGELAVVRVRDGIVSVAARQGAPYGTIGPLGPTMNESGAVAFRAATRSGEPGLFLATSDGCQQVATATGRYAGFEGLPVVTDTGAVIFRAALVDGGQGIYLWHRGNTEVVAETGEQVVELARFPSVNRRGLVAYCAVERSGAAAVLVGGAGEHPRRVVELGSTFESFRGALVTDDEQVIFYATPVGGQLGIYSGPTQLDRVLGIGSLLAGNAVTSFVLNPVSMNNARQLAIRVELADGSEAIVRADPISE